MESDESKSNVIEEIGRRVPKVSFFSVGTANDWIDKVTDEQVLERVKIFKERMGLSDTAIESILDGGNYGHTLRTDKNDEFFIEFDLDKDVHLASIRKKALLVITSDKTMDKFEEFKNRGGFSFEEIAKMLKGASEWTIDAIDNLMEENRLHNYDLLVLKGKLSLDEIANAIEGAARDYDNSGDIEIDSRIDDLYEQHVKLTPAEEEMEERRAFSDIERAKIVPEGASITEPTSIQVFKDRATNNSHEK